LVDPLLPQCHNQKKFVTERVKEWAIGISVSNNDVTMQYTVATGTYTYCRKSMHEMQRYEPTMTMRFVCD